MHAVNLFCVRSANINQFIFYDDRTFMIFFNSVNIALLKRKKAAF